MAVTSVNTFEIRHIAPGFEALKGRVGALYVCTDGLVNANRIRINTSALGARLPTMHGYRDFVEAGGLMRCRRRCSPASTGGLNEARVIVGPGT